MPFGFFFKNLIRRSQFRLAFRLNYQTELAPTKNRLLHLLLPAVHAFLGPTSLVAMGSGFFLLIVFDFCIARRAPPACAEAGAGPRPRFLTSYLCGLCALGAALRLCFGTWA
jgi:hypothetical protein